MSALCVVCLAMSHDWGLFHSISRFQGCTCMDLSDPPRLCLKTKVLLVEHNLREWKREKNGKGLRKKVGM